MSVGAEVAKLLKVKPGLLMLLSFLLYFRDDIEDMMEGSTGYKPGDGTRGTSSYFYPYTTSTFTGNFDKLDESGRYSPGSDARGKSSYSYYETTSTFTGGKKAKSQTEKVDGNTRLSTGITYKADLADTTLSVDPEPRSKRSGSNYEEKHSILSVLRSGLSYINTFSTLEVGAAELPPEMKKQYAKNQPNNPYENKTSTNASISEDLTNSTFSENKYGPQQIEYIITVPVEINTTVNEAEKFDVKQLLRTIGPEVENEIRGFISTQGLRVALDR